MDCLDDAGLRRFLAGGMPLADEERLREHLDGCRTCLTRLEGLDPAAAPDTSPRTPPDDGPTRTVAPPSGALSAPTRPPVPPPPPEPPVARGTTVGRYVVLDVIGQGGMGVVYAAYDPELDRKVALKLLQPGQAGSSGGPARLHREAQSMAQLSHPNVIAVHDVGTWSGQVFMAMELVDGRTLGAWLREAPRTWREVLNVLSAAGRGLAAAHAQGLVHRDFKPDNVLVAKDGAVRVTDFGLARPARSVSGEYRMAPEAQDTDEWSRPVLDAPLTQAGSVIGTPGYMSPEQFVGAPHDVRADQFSFCVTLYKALYGELPYTREEVAALARGGQAAVKEPPRESRVPAWVRRAVLRGLSARPEGRYPSMELLLGALARDPAAGLRRGAAIASMAVLTLGILGAALWGRTSATSACREPEERAQALWNADVRSTVERAFAATGKPFAAAAWRAAEQRVDHYLQAWSQAAQDSCTATRIRKDQPEAVQALRQTCFDRRFGELSALLELFREADAEIVSSALVAANALTPLKACDASQVLLAPDASAESAADAQAFGRLRALLAEAKALLDAGKHVQGVKVAEEAVALADQLGRAGLRAEAYGLFGWLKVRAGDYAGAEAKLVEAELIAEAARRDELAAESSCRLTHVLWRLSRYPEARHWARHCEAVTDRLGGDARLEALRLHMVAAVDLAESRHEEAQQNHQRALELRQKVFGDDHPDVALSYFYMGYIALIRGQIEEGLPQVDRALQIQERLFGVDHPDLGNSLSVKAMLLGAAGRSEEALGVNRRAVALFERAYDGDHPEVARATFTLANTYYFLGRYPEAVEAYRKALPIYELRFGDRDHDVGGIHANLGEMYSLLGEYDQAAHHLERARAVLAEREHHLLIWAYTSLGNLLREQRRFPEAHRHFADALALGEKTVGKEHPDLVYPLCGHGWLQLAEGKLAEAERSFGRARDLIAAARPEAHPDHALYLDGLAALALAKGRADEALSFSRRGLGLREAKLPAAHPFLARSLHGEGEALLMLGRSEEAVAALERAAAIQPAKGHPRVRAELQFALFRALRAAGATERAEAHRGLARQAYEDAGKGYVAELARVNAGR